jgi:hypothetical protein
MKWDGIPNHTKLGNAPLFLRYYLSARTARDYALPTSDRLLRSLSYHESQYRLTRLKEERTRNVEESLKET